MDRLEVVRRRLHEQRLAGEPFETPVEAVRWLGAMQAQEFAEVKWAIAERVRDCSEADVEEAFARGDFVRTHVLRPTWHFVAAEDLPWLLGLSAPRVHVANAYAYRRFELAEATLRRGAGVIAGALEAGEPMTRKELASVLAEAGIVAEGARLAYVLMNAELEGLICSGPRRGKQHTYMLLERRAPEARQMPREQALAELTLLYFRSHGPATARDFSWWSGLTLAEVGEGLELAADGLAAETDDQGTAWYRGLDSRAEAGATGAYLLSTYDETVVAYRELRSVVDGQPGRDLIGRPVVIDGRTVGSWKRKLGASEVVLEVTLFGALDRADADALDAVVERYAGFTGLPARARKLPQ